MTRSEMSIERLDASEYRDEDGLSILPVVVKQGKDSGKLSFIWCSRVMVWEAECLCK
jgi:hypothetical protein